MDREPVSVEDLPVEVVNRLLTHFKDKTNPNIVDTSHIRFEPGEFVEMGGRIEFTHDKIVGFTVVPEAATLFAAQLNIPRYIKRHNNVNWVVEFGETIYEVEAPRHRGGGRKIKYTRKHHKR